MTKLKPYFVSVKEAAEALNLTPETVYRLLDSQAIDSRYQGRRRLVVVTSLEAYAEALPSTPAEVTA